MTPTCPSCCRDLPDDAGARFCMFCGSKLMDSTPGPDPDATRDLPTRSILTIDPAAPPPRAVADDRPPERVGSYRLLRPLGAGGMGSVFEAESDDSGERVAVKLLSQKLSASPASVERFKQEGRLASQISHPRCVFVYGADTDAGRPFIVMELMPGSTLKDVVEKGGPLPPETAIVRILDVIDGLAEAHRLGVIHRDVKPSNCFLTADGRVKVGDFGLSKSLAGEDVDKQLTTTGAFLGTVLFAPPEQIRGEEVGYDSDVYSVCATLYYLLTGRAPYQHESLTAALAKAISEPPPSIRAARPDVPAALERVVLKGLERDRGRRWATLDDLRDALAELLPARQTPARPRTLVAAYLIDYLLLLILIHIPIELAEGLLGVRSRFRPGPNEWFDPLHWVGSVVYFGLLEGAFGAAAGKWLLRLRVVRVGRVGPPGVGRGLLRAAVFHLLWIGLLFVPAAAWRVPVIGPVLAVAIAAGCLTGLLQQLRRSGGFRGLHDRASGCRVIQRPRPAPRVRLVSRFPNPLEVPAAARGSLPPVVGGFAVRGKLADLPDGGAVWVAEDRSLHRRILLWVFPGDGVRNALPPVRPTRLRAVGTGEMVWDGKAFEWMAFVAPTGAPLADTVTPARPLPWPDARLVLEQVVDELRAAERDGTRPDRLGVDQLWAEPGGRVHLTEFPVPPTSKATAPPADDPAALVRQVATLALEGTPREAGGPVRAPLPPHAARILAPLFGPDPPPLDAVQRELAESHALPPRVTPAMRAAHLGVTAALASVGLVAMFAVALTWNLRAVRNAEEAYSFTVAVRSGLDNPDQVRSWIEQNEVLAPVLSPDRLPETARRLDRLIEVRRREVHALRGHLSRPERIPSDGFEDTKIPSANVGAEATARFIETADRLETHGPDSRLLRRSELRPREDEIGPTVVPLVVFPGVFVLFAFAFRGGLAYHLSGLALVQWDGRPAGRFQCAFREGLIWLPLVAVLAAVLAVQVYEPDWFYARLALSGLAVAVLVAAAAVVVRFPERGPHDRLAGTYLVPR